MSERTASSNSIYNSFSTTSDNNSYGLKQFLESNTLVAKFVFLIIVLILFVILFRLGVLFITWLLAPDPSPKLINGMVNAKNMIVFNQDPSMNYSKTILRSVNASDGIEFTWSVWIYINDLQYLNNQYRNIFYKGNADLKQNGLNFPNNAPGLYIAPNSNNLVVMMNTYDVINQEIVVPDLPINKWVNIIVRCQNNILDVYINGTIARSITLRGVPKQNYGNVYVAMNGGFDGYISNLFYYNYSLGIADILKIVNKGPNRKMIGEGGLQLRKPDYLSLRWYFYGSGDQYNPTK
jgi:hypothetical protein